MSYDTTIGQGVAYGRTSLPLDSSDRLIYVGNGGSDGADGTSDGNRLATLAAAVGMWQSGHGDQILLADAHAFPEPIPWLGFKSGRSATNPMVIQSYDRADPTNPLKFGNGHLRTGRPRLLATMSQLSAGVGPQFVAIRGLDCGPSTSVSGGQLGFTGSAAVYPGYILFENCILRHTGMAYDVNNAPAVVERLILRGCSMYGYWSGSGLFVDNANVTVEDCIEWHQGWSLNATRDDPLASGGLGTNEGIFMHTNYLTPGHGGLAEATIRRTFIVDGPADSGTHRGNTTFEYNVVMDCPIAASCGGGDSVAIKAPDGTLEIVRYNAILGSEGINSTNPRGYGIIVSNGKPLTEIHHNLIARGQPSSPNAIGLANVADAPQPAYANFHHNLIDSWVTPGLGLTYQTGGNRPDWATPYTTFANNYSDETTGGGNFNRSSLTQPNRYTVQSLAADRGFADKAAMMQYYCDHPELFPARTLQPILFTGYGMSAI